MAKKMLGLVRAKAENRLLQLQKGGSYDRKRDINSRRWAMVAVIVPRAGETQIDVMQDNTSHRYAKFLSNIRTAQLPTGRSFVAENLSFKAIPFNPDTNVWEKSPSILQLQEMKLLLQGTYQQWGRLGAPDGWDAEISGPELFPTMSDIVEVDTVAGNNALSMASFGGQGSGQFTLNVPVTFGQQVQMKHTIDLGFDPAVKFPELFPATPTAGTAANFCWVVLYQGGVTRLGV